MLSTQRWHLLLGSLRLLEEDELLPDQEAEGNGNSLLWKVMVQNSAVHLQPLTLTTARQHQTIRTPHVGTQLHPHVHRRWWFTYLSFRKVSPKNSFSLRLKCEETKSRSSYDSSLGWKKITFSPTLPVTLNIRWPSHKQLQQFPH